MRRYKGIRAYVGMPGSGKTYSMAAFGLDMVKRGYPVYVNKGFSFAPADAAGNVFDSLLDLANVPNGSVILLDEAPLWANARKWERFPESVFYRLSQVRKDGLQLAYTAIDFAMVDANLRRLTFSVYECVGITGRTFYRRRFNARNGVLGDKSSDRRICRVWSKVADQYDTLGKVSLDHLPPGAAGGPAKRPAVAPAAAVELPVDVAEWEPKVPTLWLPPVADSPNGDGA